MSSFEDDQTTISISRRNHQTLTKLGKKGQSFDDILSEVLDELAQAKKRKVWQPNFRVDRSQVLTGQISGADHQGGRSRDE